MTMLAYGKLLMNGTTVEWPPKDMIRQDIEIGAEVFGVRDTCNFQDEHRVIVGGIRLQNVGGELVWAICSYDDDDRYYECLAGDCIVMRKAPK